MFTKATNLGKKVIVSSGAKPQPMTAQVILEEARPPPRVAKSTTRDSRIVRPMNVGGNAEFCQKFNKLLLVNVKYRFPFRYHKLFST